MLKIKNNYFPPSHLPIGMAPTLVANMLASCLVSFSPMGPKAGPEGNTDWVERRGEWKRGD